MAKVYLICGKLCCGKTTYSQKLCAENDAIVLSVDELTLTVFAAILIENSKCQFVNREYNSIIFCTKLL